MDTAIPPSPPLAEVTSHPPVDALGHGDALDVLAARGFVNDVTDVEGLRAHLAGGARSFYVGFDPTAVSLHAGSLVGMMAMAWLQRCGHRPIALAGGATGRIGDPTGRDAERALIDEATVEANLAGIRRQLGLVLDLGSDAPNAGTLVDNFDWTREVTLLDFLRDVGVHASVNQMIARDSVKRRLEEREQGLTYAEFSYQLLQAFDFAHLAEQHDCLLQGGGSDQWGNIVAGIDLIRRRRGQQAFGLTWPLLTTADGSKFGKSAGNAIWLDPELTSPYGYYQYWLNAADADVVRFLKLFTFLDLDEIDELGRAHEQDPAARTAHRVLAREATRIVHGDAGVDAAERATAVLFGDAPFAGLSDEVLADAFEEAPSVEVPRHELDDGLGVLTLLTRVGASKSNGEARRLVTQGAVRLNNAVVDDPARELGPADLAGESTLVLKVGKKRYFLARFVASG
ncbi:MAG: tyrosine--tRNA ligase [Nitriliruptoraceae bacterium]|nr:tyrosine--tRNA ligase [Nitriliruptoraceae bacterium]